MAIPMNPAAPGHLPSFITPPGETDVLMVVTAVILAASILGFGILFFRLHNLPEQMAHKSKKAQLEIVSILCLIGLLTHIHAFWIAALLLAFIDIPDFPGWLGRITLAVERMAGQGSGGGASQASSLHEVGVEERRPEASAPAAAPTAPAGPPIVPGAAPGETRSRPVKKKEPSHA
jgi:hypothetical protein